MLELCKRARGKKVEYGMPLSIQNGEVVAGDIKWGWPEKMILRASEPLSGLFHVHPDVLRPQFVWKDVDAERTAKNLERKIIEREPELSDVDKLRLLLDDKLVLIGVGVPYRNYIKIITQVKELPIEEQESLKNILPLVAGMGVPVEGIGEFFKEYTISLDDEKPNYIEVDIPNIARHQEDEIPNPWMVQSPIVEVVEESESQNYPQQARRGETKRHLGSSPMAGYLE